MNMCHIAISWRGVDPSPWRPL